MSEAFFFGFAIGAFTAFFITVIFASVKYHELYKAYKDLEKINQVQGGP